MKTIIMALMKFSLGDRIANAIIDEWNYGDKVVAFYVVWSCISVAVAALVWLILPTKV